MIGILQDDHVWYMCDVRQDDTMPDWKYPIDLWTANGNKTLGLVLDFHGFHLIEFILFIFEVILCQKHYFDMDHLFNLFLKEIDFKRNGFPVVVHPLWT